MYRNSILAIAVAAAGLTGGNATAEDLSTFIQDLYGGAGIFLPPAPGVPDFIAESHVPHFTGPEQIRELSALSNGVLAGAGQYAINSTVAGVSFDLSQGVPVAVEDSLGPLLTERATTLGKGRVTLAIGYSRQKFTELDGQDIDNLSVTLTHQDCCTFNPAGPPIIEPDGQLTGFEVDTILLDIDVDLEQEVYTLQGSYGLTDKWDVGIVVPIVSIEAKARSVASVQVNSDASQFGGFPVHSFAVDPDKAVSRTGGSETGIGDVILRTKYNFMNQSPQGGFDMAVLGQLTLPTGDEDKLLGTGETKYKGMFIASKLMGRYTPHVNLAYETSTGDDELDAFSYALGMDVRMSTQLSTSFAVLGRKNPDLEEIGNHVVDGAIAMKFNPFDKHNAPLNFFVTFPLNDDGLRPDYTWGLGIDYVLN